MTGPPKPSMPATDAAPGSIRLALRPREAAQALGISERLLWTLTNRGEVPHLRLGTAVLYPVQTLRDWLAQRANGGESR